MARGWIHTVYKAGAWINELEGAGHLSSHGTKANAVAAGRLEAKSRKTEHVIHRAEPFPPRG
jgi:hypothetical protein